MLRDFCEGENIEEYAFRKFKINRSFLSLERKKDRDTFVKISKKKKKKWYLPLQPSADNP